jgi:hypothetical protein
MIHIDDATRERIKCAARLAESSVSQWVRQKLSEALDQTWPENWFALFGAGRRVRAAAGSTDRGRCAARADRLTLLLETNASFARGPRARMQRSAHTRSSPIGPNELILAATVVANEGTLVTHDTKEFRRVEGADLWRTRWSVPIRHAIARSNAIVNLGPRHGRHREWTPAGASILSMCPPPNDSSERTPALGSLALTRERWRRCVCC